MSEQSIADKSQVIRQETQQHANTRGRVADVIDDINATKANKSDIDDVDADLSAHLSDFNNPHQTTKGQIGLGNVDNTADDDKPISNAVQAALDEINTDIEGQTNWNETQDGRLDQLELHNIDQDAALGNKADRNAGNLTSENVLSWREALRIVEENYVLNIGKVTATSNTVNLALHSSGENSVRIDGTTYTKTTADTFTYIAVRPGKLKALILYALPTSQVFYMAEGVEGSEALWPTLPPGALIIMEIIAREGAQIVNPVEQDQINKYRSDDRWVEAYLNSSTPEIVRTEQLTVGCYNITAAPDVTPRIGGISNRNVWDGRKLLFRNDTGKDLDFEMIDKPESTVPVYSFAQGLTIKPGAYALFVVRYGELSVIETGGASLPEGGARGDVLEWDAENAVWSSRLTTAEAEIDAEVVNRAAAVLAEKNERIAADALKQDKSLFSSLTDKFLHFYNATTGKLEPVLKFVAGTINVLEFVGRIKADAFVLPANSKPAVANRLRSDGQRLKYADASAVESTIAYLQDLNDFNIKRVKRYIHTTNREVYPTNVDWATATITAPGHGFTHSGQKRIGLYINDLHKLLDSYNTESLEQLSDYTVIPDEWLKADCYVKVVDANTLLLCNAAGVGIIVNPSATTNKNIDWLKWHIEDYSGFEIHGIMPGLKRAEIVIKGMMSPYSTGNTNRYITPSIYMKDGSVASNLRGSKGARIIVGGQPYIVLAQPVTSGKQSQPFFTKITLDITDVIITREYIESVYNFTGGIVTKLNDSTIGTCAQNNGLEGLRITDSNINNDNVWFSNNTIIEIYAR